MNDGLPWGDQPYDFKTPAEIVDDYVLVRGDLSEEYARRQLALVIERHIAAAEQRVTAKVEAALRLIAPDHITPMGARQVKKAMEKAEGER